MICYVLPVKKSHFLFVSLGLASCSQTQWGHWNMLANSRYTSVTKCSHGWLSFGQLGWRLEALSHLGRQRLHLLFCPNRGREEKRIPRVVGFLYSARFQHFIVYLKRRLNRWSLIGWDAQRRINKSSCSRFISFWYNYDLDEREYSQVYLITSTKTPSLSLRACLL